VNERRAFLVLVAVLLVILWAARSVLAPFIIAGGLAYAFEPLVSRAHGRTGWPRPVIVGIGYVALVAAVAVLLVAGSGALGAEVAVLSASGPDLVAAALKEVIHADSVTIAGTTVAVADLAAAIRGAASGLIESPGSAIHFAGVVVDVLLQSVLVLIVSFYLIVDAGRVKDFTLSLVPRADRARAAEILGHIHETLSHWLRGTLLLIALVAIVTYVFLGPILHVPFALSIAVLTGFLEIIPLVGPIVAATIAIIAALASGGTGTAIVVGVGYIVLRQIEDQVVSPIVIGRAVHLHPVVTIFAVLAGLSIYGVLGGLLGVPIAAALNVLFTDLYGARLETPLPPPEPIATPRT
jgi:predicted PurR-regulated permease PerM